MCLSSFNCFKAPRRLETKSKSTSLQKTAKEITKVVRSISASTQLASSKCRSLLLRKKGADKRENLATEELSTLPSSSFLAETYVAILESVENVQIIDALDIALQTPLPESRSISSFASEVIIEEFKTKESEVVSLVVTSPTSQSEVNLSETFLLPLITPLPEEDNHSLDEIFDVAFELTDDFKKGASALLSIEQDIEKILNPCNVPLPLSPSPSVDKLIIPVAQSGDNEETLDASIAFGLESANLSDSMIMCDEGKVVETPDTLTAINDGREMPEEPIHEFPMDSSSNDEGIESKVQQSYVTNVKLEISQLPSQISPSSSGSLIDMAFSHENNQLSTSFSEAVLSLDTLFSGTSPSKEVTKGLIPNESQFVVSLWDAYASVPEEGTGMVYDEEHESKRLSEIDSEAESVLALALLTPLPPSFSSVISLPNLFESAPSEDLGFLDSFVSLHLDNLFDDGAFCSVSGPCNSNGLDVATTFLTGLPTPPTSPLLSDGEAQGATAEVSYFPPQCIEAMPFSDAVQASDYVLPTPPASPELRSALLINLASPSPHFSPPSFPTVDLHTTTPAQPVEEEESIDEEEEEEEEEERIIDEDIIKLREHVSDVLRTWGEKAIESRNLGLRKIQLRNWLESSVDAVEACLTLIGEQKFSKKVETAPKKLGDLATKQCNRHKNIIKACTTDNFGPKGPVHPFAALSSSSPNAPAPPPPFNGQGQFIPISEGGPETGPTAKAEEQRSAKSMYMIGLASSGKNGSNTGAQVCGDVASAIREAMKNGKPKLRSTLGGRSLWSKPAGDEIHEAAQVKLRSCRDSLGVSETSSVPAPSEELEVLDPEILRQKAHRFLWALRKVKLPDSDPKKTLPMDEWVFTEAEYQKAERILKERKMQKEREQCEALDAEIRANKLKSMQINSSLGFDGWSRNLKSVVNTSTESDENGSECEQIDFRGNLRTRADGGSESVPENDEEQDGPFLHFLTALRTVSQASDLNTPSHSRPDLFNHPAFRRKMMRSGKQDDMKEVLNIYKMKKQNQERVAVIISSQEKPEFLQTRNMLKKAPENLRILQERTTDINR